MIAFGVCSADMRTTSIRGYALVITAACLWATIGLFYRVLAAQYALSNGVIVAYRAGIAAVVLGGVLLLVRPQTLRVRRRDWGFFASFGTIGVAAFYWCYVQATVRGPLAVAAVLLYTAPVWITVWAVRRDGERLDRRKALSLVLAVGGCALVANIFDPVNLRINGAALVFGVLSGLGYAAYSVYSALGTRRGYGVWTVVTYSLGIGALVLFATQPLAETLKPWQTSGAWPYLLGVALGPTLLAPVCFTRGLQYVRTSNASVVATLEPVVAALLGFFVAEPPEALGGGQIVGMVGVVGAVVLASGTRARDVGRKDGKSCTRGGST